jgi:hypothetical protein
MFKALLTVTVIAFGLSGCAKSSYTVGNNFATENINQIVKGETTAEQLKALFGQPYSKYVLSEKQTKWMYIYNEGTAKAQSYLFTAKIESSGTQKVLDILLTDDVVTNYTFTEGAMPGINVN